ncbi:MAG: protoporphyrinogen oxidase HemJ [Stappiaceae bacterium]
MSDPYLWFKSLHIMSIIAWMAGLFYLPRLFVYHADSTVGSEQSETFKIMERRLLKAITTPAMISSWIFGLLAAWQIDAFSDGWFHAKLLLVLIMTGYHGYLAKFQKAFASDRNVKPAKFFRIVNEVPTLLMAVIVILVVFKPF